MRDRPRADAYARAMSEADELKALAERYLDLWERQAVLLTDAALGPEVFAAWMAALGAGRTGEGSHDAAQEPDGTG